MKYVQTFTVSGSGQFPFDMLRYDRCWPVQESEMWKFSDDGQRTLELRRYATNKNDFPTFPRWSSFGWQLDHDSVRTEKAA